MTERVDIANMALTLLGEQDITSFEDDHQRARIMKIHYAPARDATLEAHEWSFAIRRFVPGKLATAPVFGMGNAFEVPSDIFRVLTVDRNDLGYASYPITGQDQVEWVIEQNTILCNEEVIYCRGLQRVTQEGRFSPLFVSAMAAQLAALGAMALTASSDIQKSMFAIFAAYIQQAKTRDGLQGRSRRLRQRTLERVR